MLAPAEYLRRLQAALDGRRDPLDDAELCAFLDTHPDELERFAVFRQRLRVLPAAAAARPGHLPARKSMLLVAAAGAVLALLFLAPAQPDGQGAAAPGRVLTATLQELRPRAYAAVTYTVHEVFVATPTTTLETFELRSERR